MTEKKIKIKTPEFEAKADLLEDKTPNTCKNILKELPLEGKASLYKEEIYFSVPMKIEPENATEDTKAGDVSYWPEGPAICIFFGESKPVSPVNTFARIKENTKRFANVKKEEKIKVLKC
ncbi:MAG: cyclophilin-like fold protein [Candidatus Hadarchaeia archaeon]